MTMGTMMPQNSGVGGGAVIKSTVVLSDQMQMEKEHLLSILNTKVRHLYDISGFDASSKPSTLYMLSQLESKLEMLLHDTEEIPDEFMVRAEKEKEKKRRELKRAQQQEQQEKQQEERNRRAIERSMQAPKKRNGPPVMYRSRLIRREQKNTGDEDDSKDNNDEVKYLS
jgi:FKBP-type peptidyl-prolyl cis-trans isomerase